MFRLFRQFVFQFIQIKRVNDAFDGLGADARLKYLAVFQAHIVILRFRKHLLNMQTFELVFRFGKSVFQSFFFVRVFFRLGLVLVVALQFFKRLRAQIFVDMRDDVSGKIIYFFKLVERDIKQGTDL